MLDDVQQVNLMIQLFAPLLKKTVHFGGLMATAFEAKTAVESAKLLPTVVPIVSFFKCLPKHLLF